MERLDDKPERLGDVVRMMRTFAWVRFLLPLFCMPSLSLAQPTVGMLSYDPSKAQDGFTLLYPHEQANVYLINNCGEVVHVWTDEPQWRPGVSAYLLPDGHLVKTKRPAQVSNDRIWAGGGGAIVEIRDWDNRLVWSFELNNDTARLHHDIEPLANGNILMIAWEIKTMEEAIEAGRDPSLIEGGEVWADFILEVDPARDSIVWQWHVWDHLIQDFDSTKSNYGVVADHPGRLNVNFVRDAAPNWMHSNAIAYNEELRQIVLSSPYLNEFYVIDHTTTSAQASGRTGGLGGRGGDFMYRWGNLQAYDRGTSADQRSFFQHDVHWLEPLADPGHQYHGMMAFYNNEFAPGSYSTVSIIRQPWDMYTWSYTLDDGRWGPDTYEANLTHPDTLAMYSSGLSSVQLLPNGNFLICSGRQGYGFELTPAGQLAWEYKTPLKGGAAVVQGAVLQLNDNLTFRMRKYPADYGSFIGRDLTPKFYLELEPDVEYCDLLLSTDEMKLPDQVKIFPNPARDAIVVDWSGSPLRDVRIYDLHGRLVHLARNVHAGELVLLHNLRAGMYIVSVGPGANRRIVVYD